MAYCISFLKDTDEWVNEIVYVNVCVMDVKELCEIHKTQQKQTIVMFQGQY